MIAGKGLALRSNHSVNETNRGRDVKTPSPTKVGEGVRGMMKGHGYLCFIRHFCSWRHYGKFFECFGSTLGDRSWHWQALFLFFLFQAVVVVRAYSYCEFRTASGQVRIL